jgi:hypothetical protein
MLLVAIVPILYYCRLMKLIFNNNDCENCPTQKNCLDFVDKSRILEQMFKRLGLDVKEGSITCSAAETNPDIEGCKAEFVAPSTSKRGVRTIEEFGLAGTQLEELSKNAQVKNQQLITSPGVGY